MPSRPCGRFARNWKSRAGHGEAVFDFNGSGTDEIELGSAADTKARPGRFVAVSNPVRTDISLDRGPAEEDESAADELQSGETLSGGGASPSMWL